MPNHENASGRRVLAAQRERQALELRLAGATYQFIAEKTGYRHAASAYRAVMRGLARIRAGAAETAEQLRLVEDARLDRMLRALDDRIRAGDVAAVNVVLRIMQRRAAMWGLDAPVSVAQDVTGEIIVKWQDADNTIPAAPGPGGVPQ